MCKIISIPVVFAMDDLEPSILGSKKQFVSDINLTAYFIVGMSIIFVN